MQYIYSDDLKLQPINTATAKNVLDICKHQLNANFLILSETPQSAKQIADTYLSSIIAGSLNSGDYCRLNFSYGAKYIFREGGSIAVAGLHAYINKLKEPIEIDLDGVLMQIEQPIHLFDNVLIDDTNNIAKDAVDYIRYNLSSGVFEILPNGIPDDQKVGSCSGSDGIQTLNNFLNEFKIIPETYCK